MKRFPIYPFLIFLFGHNIKKVQPIESFQGFLNLINTWYSIPREEIFLQIDQPNFEPGDTVWFKAFLINRMNHKPSYLSKIIHIHLLNSRNEILESELIRTDITSGSGYLPIPKQLLPGIYKLVAYTNYMLNFPSHSYNIQPIIINSEKEEFPIIKKRKLPKNLTFKKNDIQFLPESGNLINGYPCVTAFKAINSQGKGIGLKGIVTDNNNTKVTEFSSEHDGMGKFQLEPIHGRTYTAHVIFADGTKGDYPLPKTNNYAFIININGQNKNKITATIVPGDSLYHKNIKTYLVALSGGKVVYAARGTDAYRVNFNSSNFPMGICNITLFDTKFQPIAERLIFINKKGIHVALFPEKENYGAKEKINLQFKVTDSDTMLMPGDYSIAVFDSSKITDMYSNFNIVTKLLLSDELKGEIEDPGYYFRSDTGRNRFLDLVMLTNGWSRYYWHQINEKEYPLINFKPETEQFISGKVLNRKKLPVKRGIVTLISKQGKMLFLNQTTDDSGNFEFHNLTFDNGTQLILSATTAKGKQNGLRIILDSSQTKKMVEPTITQTESIFQRGILNKIKTLKKKAVGNSSIKGFELPTFTKTSKIRNIDQEPPLTAPGYTISSDEIRSFTNILDALTLVPGVFVTRDSNGDSHVRIDNSYSNSGSTDPLVVIDGTELTGTGAIDQIDNLSPEMVDSIIVVTDASAAVYGVRGGYGVIEIFTKKNQSFSNRTVTGGLKEFYPIGYQEPKEFYSPRYKSVKEHKSLLPDRRYLIYWDGDIETSDKKGATISFYSADPIAEYKVILQGITNNGVPIFKEIFINRNSP